MRCVRLELLHQAPFRGDRAREDHQAAGLAVEAMDRSDRRGHAALAPHPRVDFRDDQRQQLLEGRSKLPAALRPQLFFGVSRAGDARRFFQYDEMLVEILKPHVALAGRLGRRVGEQLDDVPLGEPAAFIEAKIAVELDPARLNQPPHVRPTAAGEPFAQCSRQGSASEILLDVKGGIRFVPRRSRHYDLRQTRPLRLATTAVNSLRRRVNSATSFGPAGCT
jgi:hypothetical protein